MLSKGHTSPHTYFIVEFSDLEHTPSGTTKHLNFQLFSGVSFVEGLIYIFNLFFWYCWWQKIISCRHLFDRPRVKPITEDPTNEKTRYMIFSEKVKTPGKWCVLLNRTFIFISGFMKNDQKRQNSWDKGYCLIKYIYV